MTGSQRQHAKRQLNRLARIRAMLQDEPFQVATCAGCRTPLNNYTQGCQQCNDRRNRRERRQLEERREADRIASRNAKRRARARARSQKAPVENRC